MHVRQDLVPSQGVNEMILYLTQLWTKVLTLRSMSSLDMSQSSLLLNIVNTYNSTGYKWCKISSAYNN